MCGHSRVAHRHYRPGSDCANCGPEVCRRYRKNSLFGRAGRWLARRKGDNGTTATSLTETQAGLEREIPVIGPAAMRCVDIGLTE